MTAHQIGLRNDKTTIVVHSAPRQAMHFHYKLNSDEIACAIKVQVRMVLAKGTSVNHALETILNKSMGESIEPRAGT